jgi:cytochrome c-type biogenesis protein CcmH/NrfG
MRADSTDPWGWLAVAEVERRRSHLDLAGQAIQRALQLDSSLAPAWAIVGRLAAAVGDTAKVRQAISVLEHLNRIDPGLYVLRALLLRSSGSLGEAVAVWRELLDPRM